jgi:hypothetical protein
MARRWSSYAHTSCVAPSPPDQKIGHDFRIRETPQCSCSLRPRSHPDDNQGNEAGGRNSPAERARLLETPVRTLPPSYEAYTDYSAGWQLLGKSGNFSGQRNLLWERRTNHRRNSSNPSPPSLSSKRKSKKRSKSENPLSFQPVVNPWACSSTNRSLACGISYMYSYYIIHSISSWLIINDACICSHHLPSSLVPSSSSTREASCSQLQTLQS